MSASLRVLAPQVFAPTQRAPSPAWPVIRASSWHLTGAHVKVHWNGRLAAVARFYDLDAIIFTVICSNIVSHYLPSYVMHDFSHMFSVVWKFFGLDVKTWANLKWRTVIYSWCGYVMPVTSVCVSIQMSMNVRTPGCVWEVNAQTPSAPIAAPAPLAWSWWMGRSAEV